MLIRCEKCSTVYDLEDRLIPPGGAPVQCSRCEHVFRAVRIDGAAPLHLAPPPEPLPDAPADLAANAELQEASAELEEASAEPQVAPEPPPRPPPPARQVEPPATFVPPPALPEPPAPRPRTTPPPVAARSPSRAGPATPANAQPAHPPPNGVTADGRPVRKVPNPELEGGEPTISTAPRKAISFEVGPKKRRTGSWAIAGAASLLAAFAIAGVVLRWRESAASAPAPPPRAAAAPSDPAAARARQDGLALLARDDAASLERATTLLTEAARKENTPGARADRALALALLAQEARDDAERLQGRARSAEEQRAAATAAGDAARAAALAVDAEGFTAGVSPARERASRLAAEARGELDALPADRQRDPLVLRARAMALVAAGDRAGAARISREARTAVPDPWLVLAGIMADLPENAGAEEHTRALERLDKLAAAHPEIVRARLAAARIRAGMGDTDAALGSLDGVLQVNPEHVEARRLKAEVAALAIAPAGEPAAAPLPEAEPAPGAAEAGPAGNAASQPRNPGAQPKAR